MAAAKGETSVSKNPRDWTAEQRREAFLKARKAEEKEEAKDYQILRKDFHEELVPYGLITFDHVLCLGGIGRHGRVWQIHGDEGAGKSTLTYVMSKNYQQNTGEPLGIFDFERTGTPLYLQRIGVDMDLCMFRQPDSVEDAIVETVRLMEQGVRFFIYDSIPRMKSMVPVKEIISGKAFKGNYGKHAQVMSRFYDLLLPYAAKYDACMFMVNQTRDRIEDSQEAQNAQKYPSFTNRPYSLPGGRICRFTPSVMIEMKLINAYKPIGAKPSTSKGPQNDPFIMEPATAATDGKLVVNRVRCRTLKNKVTGGGFREGYVWVRPGIGIDDNMSVREYAREYGLIANSGKKWYVGKSADEAIAGYPDRDSAVDDLVVKQNPEVLGKLRELVIECIKNDTTSRFATDVSEAEARYLDGEEIEAEAVTTTPFEVDAEEL